MRAISLYWYRAEDNFGDAFSPMAFQYCTGTIPVPSGKWSCDVVGEGSVLDFVLLRDSFSVRGRINRVLRRPLWVWGSGILFPLTGVSAGQTIIRRPRFLALRGRRTLAELLAIGLCVKDDVVFGDPGLFMPEVLGIRPAPRFRRGFVPHAYFWKTGNAERFARENPGIRLIDPRKSPREVVSEIAACDEIFSSSLHGLVVADALQIPNRWVALETPFANLAWNRFKFEDYYSAFGTVRTPCRVSEIATECPVDPVDADCVMQAKDSLCMCAQILLKRIRSNG